MARKPERHSPAVAAMPDVQWLSVLSGDAPAAAVAGPGSWLVVEYSPTSLFSLKTSQATSSVGVSLVIPTPYAIKMAFVDAAFRAGFAQEEDYDSFLRSLALVDVRIGPAQAAVVTNTFLKIRQESREGDPLRPYGPAIAYREMVFLRGSWLWAFDLAGGDELLAERLVRLAPYVNYVGKRGSFIQFQGLHRRTELGAGFTQPVHGNGLWQGLTRAHVRVLDDFGLEANLEILSSYTSQKPKRERHRRFVQTIIPAGIVNTGPGFAEYRT